MPSYGTSTSIDLGQTSGGENSECSDVGEQPPEEADNLVLSDDDSVCDEGPGLDLEEELTASWDPGSTVGKWYPQGQPINESSQVLVLNVYLEQNVARSTCQRYCHCSGQGRC